MVNERRAFLKFGAVAAAGAFGVWKSFGIDPGPLNERVSRAIWNAKGLAKEYPREAARELRVNSLVGLESELGEYKLNVEAPGEAARSLTFEEVKAMPASEQTTQFTCIEGWSEIAHWKGTRLSNFAPKNAPAYVSLTTPDEEYYVGLDVESALHPQTLLAWELNGEALTSEHGAPLRLVIPVKYGIKNIKRVGTIRFTSQRPADYWQERGYDWYAGL
jgi:DMSO/TMAO reductase YedYZ molybdopterin-dependent catalytic subunit